MRIETSSVYVITVTEIRLLRLRVCVCVCVCQKYEVSFNQEFVLQQLYQYTQRFRNEVIYRQIAHDAIAKKSTVLFCTYL